MSLKYKRILLKISGEMLAGKGEFGINFDAVKVVAKEISAIKKMGVEIAIVVGGGNIFRGRFVRNKEIDKATADYMGMISTMLNAMALQSILEQEEKIGTRILSAITMMEVAEPYIRRRGIRHLEKNRITILACGSGNPYFTTDTAAVLRALELHCDVILKMTKVDGVYSADPEKDKNAKKYDKLSFREALVQDIEVMDSTAFTLCMKNNLPIKIFKFEKGNLKKAVEGKEIGTLVS
ncbi:UMP kinase [Candidatus Falkowbacteria bacterium]|jgi:uridylate kinase|nr:UMP kinase [Candidatus Falkowbacteria bacterium]MBT4433305.1 UMP kinase [Candidatus Falkowbacteria bacterium]